MKNKNKKCSYSIGYSFGFSIIDERTGAPLIGAGFELIKRGNVINMATSNSKGKVNFYNLAGGSFILIQSVSPNGYLPNPNIYYVNVITRRVITINGGFASKFVVNNTPMDTVYTVTYYDNAKGDTKVFEEKNDNIHTVIENPFGLTLEHIEWNTNTLGTGKAYYSGDSITVNENIILYAIWKTVKPVMNDINISDTAITGTGQVGAEISVTFPNGRKENTKVSDNSTWSIAIVEPLQTGQTISVTQTMISRKPSDPVEKIVSSGRRYKISYKPNGEDDGKSNIHYVESNDTYIIAENMFTSSRTFIEWNENEDGTGKAYKPGQQVTVNNNITMYARWE